MAAHDGLDIAAVFVLHLVADTRAASIRRDEPDVPDVPDVPDADDVDTDDPTTAATANTVTVTATAAVTPTGNTTGNSTSSTGAASPGGSGGSQLDQGVKAGIAIGAIVAGFFIAGAIFMIVRRHLRNRRAKRLPSHDPNNPQMVLARDTGPSGGGGGGVAGAYLPEDKRSHVSTSRKSSGDGSNRAWFDTGMGSTELEAGGGGRGRLGISSWVAEKAELPTPRRGSEDGPRRGDRAAELPDARGTRFEPVELPAAMPFIPRDRDEDSEVDRLGMMGTWRRGSEGTWGTGTISSLNSGTVVSSPTGTTLTDDITQDKISPCSTGSGSNQMGRSRA